MSASWAHTEKQTVLLVVSDYSGNESSLGSLNSEADTITSMPLQRFVLHYMTPSIFFFLASLAILDFESYIEFHNKRKATVPLG